MTLFSQRRTRADDDYAYVDKMFELSLKMNFCFDCVRVEISLTNRVRGPYSKLPRTDMEFFAPSIYGPQSEARFPASRGSFPALR